MPDLYPLLLRPEFHERVWGSRNLAPIYAQPVSGEPVGEAWLTGDACRVSNGPLAGRTLSDLSREYGLRLLGDVGDAKSDAKFDSTRFPLLIKFLFPKERLSVQVHPDDEGAALVGQPCGKTECWYVLRAEPGAQVALGLKPGVTVEEFRRAIAETRAEALLNWVDVFAGDMIYVAAGTVHTIGGDIVLVETQQTSDITYRLYDYGRPRELHLEQGLAAIKLQTNAGKVVGSAALQRRVNAGEAMGRANPSASSGQALQVRVDTGEVMGRANPSASSGQALQVLVNAAKNNVQPASAGASGDRSGFDVSSRAEPASAGGVEGPAVPSGRDEFRVLVRSPFFQVEKMPLREPMRAEVSPASPHILVAVGGAGIVESHGMEPITFATGDAVVVPACVGEYTVRPQWELELMRMSLPAGNIPEPETTLPQSAAVK
jgi:mannose-6-phosphate isomerase class I